MSELGKRVFVALIGIPLAVGIIFLGGFVFFFALLFLANFSLWELFQLAEKKNIKPMTYFGLFISSLIQTLYFLILQNFLSINKFVVLILLLLLVGSLPSILILAQVWNRQTGSISNVAVSILGLFWISFVFSSILSIRFLSDYLFLLSSFGEIKSLHRLLSFQYPLDSYWSSKFFLAILGTIWLCDTFAYFFGTAYGKHKLAPTISPKKTWEGGIAGVVGSFVVFFVLNFVFNLNLPIGFQLLFGAVVGVIGQIGDLAESKIKREFNVKDSSNLLPGHGGILDRLDSIMFVFPTLLIIFTLLAVL